MKLTLKTRIINNLLTMYQVLREMDDQLGLVVERRLPRRHRRAAGRARHRRADRGAAAAALNPERLR